MIYQEAYKENDHSLGVHALSDVELVVLEVTDNLLGKVLGALLESGNSVGVGLLELCLDGLHVTLEVGEVGLDISRAFKACFTSPSFSSWKRKNASRGLKSDWD